MTNFDRADRALAALRHYTGNKAESGAGATDFLELAPNAKAYPITDLITDLMHLAARHEVDPATLTRRALEHYGCDAIEQAWEHADGWADTLQDRSNVRRALEVLDRIGIRDFDRRDACMIMVGLYSPTCMGCGTPHALHAQVEFCEGVWGP